MMRTWHLYDLSTGLFTGKKFSSSDEKAIDLNTFGMGAIEGVTDPKSQRVDLETGALVEYVPPSPGADYEWISDENGKQWRLRPESKARMIRRQEILTRLAVLGSKTERASREYLLGLAPSQADRDAGAMTLDEIEDEIAKLRFELSITPPAG